MFDWSEVELKQLDNLSGSGNCQSIDGKKYKNICDIFESASTLVTYSRLNLAGNPGCGQQLDPISDARKWGKCKDKRGVEYVVKYVV